MRERIPIAAGRRYWNTSLMSSSVRPSNRSAASMPRQRSCSLWTGSGYEAVLGQEVIIRENGRERRVTAAEAFLLQLTKLGLDGDSAAARAAIDAIGDIRDTDLSVPYPLVIVHSFVAPGSVSPAVECLRIGTKLDQYRETARMVLEPWIVEAALARFGEKQLTPQEQEVVLKATRTPTKVRWPDWWVVMP